MVVNRCLFPWTEAMMITENQNEKQSTKSEHIQYSILINELIVTLNFPKKAEPIILDEIKNAILIGSIKT